MQMLRNLRGKTGLYEFDGKSKANTRVKLFMINNLNCAGAAIGIVIGVAAAQQSLGQLANGTHLFSEAPDTITLGESLDVVTGVKNTGPVNYWSRWQMCFLYPSWPASWASSWKSFMINGHVPIGATNYALRTLSAADLPSSPGTYSFEVRAYYEASPNIFDFMSNTFKVVQFTVLPAPPRFTSIKALGNTISMTITNLLPGSTNDILFSSALDAALWSTGKTFVATSYATNWSHTPSQNRAFYRVRQR